MPLNKLVVKVSDVKALTNSLSGKVAGLDIKSSEISVGLQVVIRGNSSIQGNNQALCCWWCTNW
jgi:ubiquinone biosynthesis protein UbiJ